jgi:uncharacterized membrane protein
LLLVPATRCHGAIALRARRHDVDGHRKRMLGLFFGALVIAGAFTFVPGRIMYKVAFGP